MTAPSLGRRFPPCRNLPLLGVAARIGLGVQYDFHENWGTYLGAGASLGYGSGLQVGADIGVGLQFRFGTAG